MPNRIIKESAFLSDTIAELTDFEFRLWVGLITYVDDAGRGDARPAVIKGRVFALRDRVTVKDIDAALHALAAKGCVSLYTVGGKPYFWFPSWAEHQRIRDSKPKYPGPEDADPCEPSSATCGDLPQPAAERGLNPNPNPNPNPNSADAFERFWTVYPKKVGKQDALKAFKKVTESIDALIAAVEQQKMSEQWTKDGGQYIPNPSTWLNQGRWEDQLPPARTGQGNKVQATCTNYPKVNLADFMSSTENI